jgi:outer membrane protein TolC
LRVSLDLQSRRADLFERRVDAGENARADWRRELAQREQLSVALAQAQADLAQSRADLAQAIGVPVVALDAINLDLESIDRAPDFDGSSIGRGLSERALTGRADVQDALAQLAAAQADLQIELSRRWPDVRLGPGYQFDLGANKYAVATSLDWPRATVGPIAEATARRELAALELLALQARVLSRVDHAVALWQATAPMAQSAGLMMSQAEQREQSAERLFAAGALDRPSLLAARLDRIEAARSRQAALERQRRALAALEDAVQATLEPGRPGPVAPEADPDPGVAAVSLP